MRTTFYLSTIYDNPQTYHFYAEYHQFSFAHLTQYSVQCYTSDIRLPIDFDGHRLMSKKKYK